MCIAVRRSSASCRRWWARRSVRRSRPARPNYEASLASRFSSPSPSISDVPLHHVADVVVATYCTWPRVAHQLLPGLEALEVPDGRYDTPRQPGSSAASRAGCNVAMAPKLARKHPELTSIVTVVNDTGQRYLTTALCGEDKHVEIPERDHPLDAHTRRPARPPPVRPGTDR